MPGRNLVRAEVIDVIAETAWEGGVQVPTKHGRVWALSQTGILSVVVIPAVA